MGRRRQVTAAQRATREATREERPERSVWQNGILRIGDGVHHLGLDGFSTVPSTRTFSSLQLWCGTSTLPVPPRQHLRVWYGVLRVHRGADHHILGERINVSWGG